MLPAPWHGPRVVRESIKALDVVNNNCTLTCERRGMIPGAEHRRLRSLKKACNAARDLAS